MKIQTLNEAFERGLSDICNAEKQIARALPKMIEGASNEELVELIASHLEETQGQIAKLERVAEMCDVMLKEGTCEPMKGLLEEGEKIVAAIRSGPVRDAVLIANAQKVEHYEIATYGTLVSVARTLGFDEAAQMLEDILAEEKSADEKLTGLAEQNINEEALAA